MVKELSDALFGSVEAEVAQKQRHARRILLRTQNALCRLCQSGLSLSLVSRFLVSLIVLGLIRILVRCGVLARRRIGQISCDPKRARVDIRSTREIAPVLDEQFPTIQRLFRQV